MNKNSDMCMWEISILIDFRAFPFTINVRGVQYRLKEYDHIYIYMCVCVCVCVCACVCVCIYIYNYIFR